jgi:hypothetical protein
MNPGSRNDSAATDALVLLRTDHDRAMALFRAFAALKGKRDADRRKGVLVEQICHLLTLHGKLEDEIFYPALRSAIDNDDLIDEADIEHAVARELIGQLDIMAPGDDYYDATVKVLGEQIEHHVAKEEGDMFDAARRAGIDLAILGRQLAARRQQLEADLSSPPASREAMHPHQSAAHEGARRQPRAPN